MNSTTRPPLDAVIFDLGGVLINFDFDVGFRGVASIVGLSLAEVRQRLLGNGVPPAMAEFECGRITGAQFHGHIQELLGRKLPYQQFVEHWNAVFADEVAPTVALARALMARGDLKVGLLSNTNAVHFDFLLQKMAVLREMKHVYASHQIAHRKPHAECYRCVLQKMAVRPERAVFVDDWAENIEGARAAGMLGIHATSPDAVRRGLTELGLV